ncbi:MAG: DNA alkylation repair protein [Chloroflexota bacterium]
MPFFDAIAREAGASRNFVKKAVNWAIRDIGKNRPNLRAQALALARQLKARPAPGARWVGADALREMESTTTLAKSAE